MQPAYARRWEPRLGVVTMVLMMFMVALAAAAVVAYAVTAHGAEIVGASGETQGPLIPEGFQWQVILQGLIPAVWGAAGPLVMAWVTAQVNHYAGQYVPRVVQVIMSSVLGATAAALAGDVGTTVTNVAMAGSAVTGGVSQVYAATKPEVLNTSDKPGTRIEVTQ